jgi:hypothetical protein
VVVLERVRRGEDVMGTKTGGGEGEEEAAEEEVEEPEDLYKLEEREIEAVKREKVEKKGSMAPPRVAGVKRTRDEIMAELKAQRKAAAEAKAKAAPMLDGRWKRVGAETKPKVEVDSKGREVMITVGEDGVVKKKVRKLAEGRAAEEKAAASMPDSTKEVLGADYAVPEQPQQAPPEEDEDDDIFDDVGTDYNPLGEELDDDDDDDSDDSDNDDELTRPAKLKEKNPSSEDITPPEPSEDPSRQSVPSQPPNISAAPKRNYFNEKPTTRNR